MTESQRSDYGFIFGRELESDPLMTSIKLARFKFVSRMLSPSDRVLDLGCGSGYCSYFYSRFAEQVVGVDLFSDIPQARLKYPGENLRFISGDVLDLPAEVAAMVFDAVVSTDVIEHFSKEDGERIIANSHKLLSDRGMMIVGTPSKFSSAYRSAQSRAGHIHEYEPDELRDLCGRYFKRTLLFSMNDELVHTGFSKLAWFVFVLGFK
jgi:2-polyprenyl-3-methyl-5-hydroxy-6-metoxy-1,4-benzoquinol methylase